MSCSAVFNLDLLRDYIWDHWTSSGASIVMLIDVNIPSDARIDFPHQIKYNKLNLKVMYVCVQVSEQQLNEAIAHAVENSKLKRDKSHWSMEGKYDSAFLNRL